MRQFLISIIFSLALAYTETGQAQGKPSEYQVKAAYLYNFAKFIRWPDTTFSNPDSPLVIGVLGQNPFADKLLPLRSRTVRNRPIEIKTLISLKQAQTCHMIYISTQEPTELKTILNTLKAHPLITVGDGKRFASHGGVIQFITIRGRLRFMINLDAAKANQVQIDAQLLSLAMNILETKQ